MKLGLVLLTYVYTPQRVGWAVRSFESLVKTKVENRVPMQLTYKKGWIEMDQYYAPLSTVFDMKICTDDDLLVTGIDRNFIVSAEKLWRDHPDVTHVFLLTDDFVYHPDWYLELCRLIERKPDGIAWTVYKSANVRHHRVIDYIDGDYRVTSISGTGAVSREEWVKYDAKHQYNFEVPPPEGGGSTLDLHHAWIRKGNRWATEKDYMNHIGELGINCRPGVPEYALNFVGEGQ